MNTVGLVWACPTIGHTQFIAVRIGKMKVFCPNNWESTLANNSRGDNEVSSLEFGGTVCSQKPNWTYINCESWCILHFRPFLAPFQTPILLPTCQVMIVDVQLYICCWMSYSAYIALSEGWIPQSRGFIPHFSQQANNNEWPVYQCLSYAPYVCNFNDIDYIDYYIIESHLGVILYWGAIFTE